MTLNIQRWGGWRHHGGEGRDGVAVPDCGAMKAEYLNIYGTLFLPQN